MTIRRLCLISATLIAQGATLCSPAIKPMEPIAAMAAIMAQEHVSTTGKPATIATQDNCGSGTDATGTHIVETLKKCCLSLKNMALDTLKVKPPTTMFPDLSVATAKSIGSSLLTRCTLAAIYKSILWCIPAAATLNPLALGMGTIICTCIAGDLVDTYAIPAVTSGITGLLRLALRTA